MLISDKSFLEEELCLPDTGNSLVSCCFSELLPGNPARIKVDFTRYSLRVKNEGRLSAVSQGKMKIENGYTVFESETPLTGLTLAIGDYHI